MRIVCAGEAMIELVPTGADCEYRRSFAGDTFNTAWYLAQIHPDWSIDYLTTVGRDRLSEDFCSFVRRAGIGTEHIARHETRSLGLYLIELQEGERSFQYWRERSAARLLADDPVALAAAFAGADMIYFSGITLAILADDARKRFFSALDMAQSKGARIAFDPNLRPRLWPDLDEMRSVITQGARLADIVLPSFDEEAHFFGDATPDATIARYQSAGSKAVVVKNGDGPIHFTGGQSQEPIFPRAVSEVVDTTAAGDSFNAAFIAGHLSATDAKSAIEAACRLSSYVISARGALVDVPENILDQSK